MIRRIQVTGSREWPDDEPAWAAVVTDALDYQRGRLAPGDVMLAVVGYDPVRCYPPGVDRIVYDWAVHHRMVADRHRAAVDVETHPANWRAYGRAAGQLRNGDMLDVLEERLQPGDLIMAWCRDNSPGTTGLIGKAQRRHLNLQAWFCYSERMPPAGPAHEQLQLG